jgi:hypothetical protein
MGPDPKLLQFLDRAWEWTKQDTSNWLRMFADPNSVVKELNLEKEETLNFSLRLSAFSFAISELLALPARLFFTPKVVDYRFVFSEFVVFYLQILLFSFVLKTVSAMLRCRGTLRACLTLTLLMTVYVVPLSLFDGGVLKDQSAYRAAMSGSHEFQGWEFFVLGLGMDLYGAFVGVRWIGSLRSAFQVSTFRSIILGGVSFVVWSGIFWELVAPLQRFILGVA